MLKNLSEVNYNTRDHPYYANHVLWSPQQQKKGGTRPKNLTGLPGPENKDIDWVSTIEKRSKQAQGVIEDTLPEGLGQFISRVLSSVVELVVDISNLEWTNTIGQARSVLVKNNRLFYLGVGCILLYCSKYLVDRLLS